MANFNTVSADQIEAFRRDGFLHIPGLIDEPALALLRAAMDDLFGVSDGDPGINNVTAYATKAKARGDTVLADRDGPATGRFLIRQNTWFGDARIRDFGSQSPLPEVAAALMGADQLSFLGDHLFLKEPGSLYRTAFHQDSAYFHCIGEQCCSFWVSLDTVTRESGRHGLRTGLAPLGAAISEPSPGSRTASTGTARAKTCRPSKRMKRVGVCAMSRPRLAMSSFTITRRSMARPAISVQPRSAAPPLFAISAPICATASNPVANFQLPTSSIFRVAPRAMSVNRERPRHMTMLPGGGSLARSR